jgi:hypothetical protein
LAATLDDQPADGVRELMMLIDNELQPVHRRARP